MKLHPEYLEAYREVERIATGYLKDATTIPTTEDLSRWWLKNRWWHYPAFGNWQSWSVFERSGQSRQRFLLLRKVTWDRIADIPRFSDPMTGLREGVHRFPAIEVRDRSLNLDEFERSMERLSNIQIPLTWRKSIRLDGAEFGYSSDSDSIGFVLRWWCNEPAEWSRLIEWASEVRTWLDEVAATPAD
jgi:hypothetical protein